MSALATPLSNSVSNTAPGKQWIIAPPHPGRAELARDAGVDPFVAQILLNRGIQTAADYRRFINPDFKELHAPDGLPNAVAAGRRLAAAVRRQEPIVLYGDYDVDGVTGVTILWHVLTACGAKPRVVLPSRFEHGYGLHASVIEAIAADGGHVVVSVDCGISAVDAARRARELGLVLIITDHHQRGAVLPDAELIVHPTIGEAPCPNRDLSGAGVALKVAWALAREFSGGPRVGDALRDVLVDCTAFAALGLIADSVPMTGENRIIASFGLRQLCHSRNPGLRALLEAAGLARKASYDDYDVGFALAPRLNAVGRMDHAREAVELFTTATPEQAREIAERLNQLNLERQRIERQMVAHACELTVQRGFDRDGCRAIVLGHEDWHPGVIGIVAARLVERFGRPTLLFALKDGVGQGSARSVKHFPLHEMLGECQEHLLNFGGHAMAAGAKIRSDEIDAFTAAFQKQAAQRLTAFDLIPKLALDDEVSLPDLTPDTAAPLLRLAPFGVDNSRPRLASGPVQLAEPPRVVGEKGAHLQFRVRQGVECRRAIAFGQANQAVAIQEAGTFRLAFEPLIDHWQGRATITLKVVAWQPVV